MKINIYIFAAIIGLQILINDLRNKTRKSKIQIRKSLN
jgi:hypothetical protein